MSIIDIDALLAEVSAGAPCGPDVSDELAFQEMEQASRGKPETQMGSVIVPPEKPNWREVRSKALQLLARSKDLRAAVCLSRALLDSDGWDGFGDGLELLRGLLERYWEGVHPQLDPADGNDPLMRINRIAELRASETTLRSVREVPLVSAPGFARVSLRDILIATGKMNAPADGSPAPEPASIQGAFMTCDLEELQGTARAVARC
jgi:type VI secretion system protein ImpA